MNLDNELDRTIREFIPHRDSEYIPDLISALKDLFRKCVPEPAIRDDEPLQSDANATQVYDKMAHNNMADGFNLCRSQTLKNIDGEQERTER